jgi:glycosyltransferase involved in cell wall biosynthesis
VPLESLACGTAVLAPDDGGVPETVEHGVTGWCVPGLDRAELARRLVAVPGSVERLTAMGRRAADRVRSRFDPRDSIRQLVQMLEALLLPR